MKKRLKIAHKVVLNKAPEQVPAVVCNDIEQLSFANFIKCAVNNDFSALIISGNPTAQQLFHAWITILSAYYTLTGSKDSLRYVKLVSKMEALNSKIVVVTALVEAIKKWFDPKLTNQLKAWGYRLSYTADTIIADLARVEIELSNDQFKLEKLRIDFEKQEREKGKKGQKATKESYMKILYAIEKYRVQRYPADKISTYEFAMWYNELIEYSESIKAATKNGK